MDDNYKIIIEKTSGQISSQTLPRWEDLPDLDLYMDQILGLISRYLITYPGYDRGLTASMVNNYVKLGIIPPPSRKRYSRIHLAYLLIICILKNILPIAGIKTLIDAALIDSDIESFYNRFCSGFEQSVKEAASSIVIRDSDHVSPVLSAALRAQAEQAIATRLHLELLSSDP